jgi:hypothetical protein
VSAPTDRALLKWWDVKAAELRAADVLALTCADCGKVDSPAYVQPQHPYYADGRDDIAEGLDGSEQVILRKRVT